MTNQDLGISIIFPIYFREETTEGIRFFRRALDSIFDQRFPGPFEVLVVDDSPRPFSGLLELNNDIGSSVRCIRLPRNNGLVPALNIGLREARFPLIARLDADDCWCPGKIEKQMLLLTNDSDLSIVATGMTLVTPTGEVMQRLVRPGDWTGILRFFVQVGCPFPHGSIVARKDIFRLLGGYPHDPNINQCEDFALWGVWLRFFKPAMVEEVLYDYTVSPTAKSAKNEQDLMRATMLVLNSFAALNLADRLPGALSKLAELLGVSVLQAGVLCYRMWHYRVPVHLPREALEPLREILCDRDFFLIDDGSSHVIGLDEALRGFSSPKQKFKQYKDSIRAAKF